MARYIRHSIFFKPIQCDNVRTLLRLLSNKYAKSDAVRIPKLMRFTLQESSRSTKASAPKMQGPESKS